MITTKNTRTLTDEINNVFASWRRSPGSPTPQQPTVRTKPPVASITREAAEALASHLKRHPIATAPTETPFMRGLRRMVAFQKRIADDNARWQAEQNSPPVVATPQEILDQRCLVAEQPVPELPAPEPRIIAVPVMVGRLGRH